jgi:hypothetical protein
MCVSSSIPTKILCEVISFPNRVACSSHTNLTFIDPTSSYIRQCIPLYKVQCPAQIDALFYNVLCYFP